MLGFNKKVKDAALLVQAAILPVKLMSDETFVKMTDILATVGLDDPDHYGFKHHVLNRQSYWGGSFEWSERGKDMRFFLNARDNEPVRNVYVVVLSGGDNSRYPNEVIAEANRQLSELFES